VRGGRAVLGWILVTTAGSDLHDSLYTNVQGFEFLEDDAFRHSPAQILHEFPYTAVIPERESVKSHTLLPIKGLQFTDRGTEPVDSRWDDQILAL
jgi:hypothetical protein